MHFDGIFIGHCSFRMLLLTYAYHGELIVTREEDGREQKAAYLVAGLADLVREHVRDAAMRLPNLDEVCEELRARGELALRRNSPTKDSHLEMLARRVVSRNSDA